MRKVLLLSAASLGVLALAACSNSASVVPSNTMESSSSVEGMMDASSSAMMDASSSAVSDAGAAMSAGVDAGAAMEASSGL